MALIKCPDCSKEISDKAFVCIECGRPMRTPYGELIYSLMTRPSATDKIYTLLKWVLILSVADSIIIGIWLIALS